MKTDGNTIVITGGATGIGFALAEKLVKLGNTVIICGRRKQKLDAAKKKLPNLHTLQCDVSTEEGRKMLFDFVSSNFKDLNILVNNAGIQRNIQLTKGIEDLLKTDDEIEINLRSQIYLTVRFIPLLSQKRESAIVNVSSGLGFIPLAIFPIYCATKAAIHSFTLSLRHQLRQSGVKVFEVIPPTVYDTELKGKPMEKSDWSISSSEMADAIVAGLQNDAYEIAVGPSCKWLETSKKEKDEIFKNMNH